jgi:hypothetical protein
MFDLEGDKARERLRIRAEEVGARNRNITICIISIFRILDKANNLRTFPETSTLSARNEQPYNIITINGNNLRSRASIETRDVQTLQIISLLTPKPFFLMMPVSCPLAQYAVVDSDSIIYLPLVPAITILISAPNVHRGSRLTAAIDVGPSFLAEDGWRVTSHLEGRYDNGDPAGIPFDDILNDDTLNVYDRPASLDDILDTILQNIYDLLTSPSFPATIHPANAHTV